MAFSEYMNFKAVNILKGVIEKFDQVNENFSWNVSKSQPLENKIINGGSKLVRFVGQKSTYSKIASINMRL